MINVFTGPAFLVGIVGWLAERLTSRSFKLAAASFYVVSIVSVLGGIFALMGLVGGAVPAIVVQAMSILAPSDWIAQVGVVLAAKTTEMVYQIFFRAYRLALS